MNVDPISLLFTVTIRVDPDHPERNGEVQVVKCELDAAAVHQRGCTTRFHGYAIFVPADQHHGIGMYHGRIKSEKTIELKVPSYPSGLLYFGQGQYETSDFGEDVRAGVTAGSNGFMADPMNGRFWKLITLEFPDGHVLDSSVVFKGGDREEENELHPVMVKIATNHFALFEVARVDIAAKHFVSLT